MNTYVALLRGINVGGDKNLGMKDLRALLRALGHAEVETYLLERRLGVTSTSRNWNTVTKLLERASARSSPRGRA